MPNPGIVRAISPSGYGLISIDGGPMVPDWGNILGPVQASLPAMPGNPLFLLDPNDLDGAANAAPSVDRALTINAADAVVAASHTWTFANGNFTFRDIGGAITVTGATNAANNGTRTITAVTSATVIVTDGVQTNETFSTPANLTVIVTDYTLSDGGPFYAAINKGAQTNVGAATSWLRQAGKLTFVKVAAQGREGNLSAIRTDGTGWMQSSPAVPALAQPMTVAIVFSIDSIAVAASNLGVFDGLGATRAWSTITAPSGVVNIGSAGGATPSGAIMFGAQYQTLIVVFNGASSFARLNGVQYGNVNPTMGGGVTGMTLLSQVGGANPMRAGDMLFAGCWVDGTSPALIEQALAAQFGSNPQ